MDQKVCCLGEVPLLWVLNGQVPCVLNNSLVLSFTIWKHHLEVHYMIFKGKWSRDHLRNILSNGDHTRCLLWWPEATTLWITTPYEEKFTITVLFGIWVTNYAAFPNRCIVELNVLSKVPVFRAPGYRDYFVPITGSNSRQVLSVTRLSKSSDGWGTVSNFLKNLHIIFKGMPSFLLLPWKICIHMSVYIYCVFAWFSLFITWYRYSLLFGISLPPAPSLASRNGISWYPRDQSWFSFHFWKFPCCGRTPAWEFQSARVIPKFSLAL